MKFKFYQNILNMIKRERFIALDIGTSSIKVIDASKNGDEIIIHDVFKVEQEAHFLKGKDLQDIHGMVEKIVHQLNLRGSSPTKALLMFTSSSGLSKLISIPKSSDRKLDRAMQYEYTSHFKHISSYTHQRDYAVVGEVETEGSKGEQKVLITAQPSIEINHLFKAFAKHRIDVHLITDQIEAMRFTSILLDSNREPKDKHILHMGNSHSYLISFKSEELVSLRFFRFGHLSLQRRDEGELSEAESKTFPKEESAWDFEHKFELFLREVYRTVVGTRVDFKLKEDPIFLSGGLAKLKGINDLIQSSIGITCYNSDLEFSDKVKGMTIRNNHQLKIPGEYYPALGLAIKECIL